MLSAVKLCQSSSISGPFGDREAEVGEDLGQLVHHLADRVDRCRCGASGAGSDRSSRSVASRRSSSASSSAALRAAIAAVTASRSAWIFGAFGRARARRPSRPAIFSSAVTSPDLPSAATRTASSAARSAAAAMSASKRGLERVDGHASFLGLERGGLKQDMAGERKEARDDRRLARASTSTRDQPTFATAPPRQPDARQAPRRPCAVGQSRLARRRSSRSPTAGDRADRRRRRADLHADARPVPPRDRAAGQRRRARRSCRSTLGSIAALHRELVAMLDRARPAVDLQRQAQRDRRRAAVRRGRRAARLSTATRPSGCATRWRAIVPVFERFRAGFRGKASPVHFFWGSFDLAVTRFSGRTAPPHPGGVPGLPDRDHPRSL